MPNRRIAVSVCLWATVCAAVPAAVAADSISDKIEKERKALEQLKGQIEEKRKQADEAGKKRDSLLQGIQSLDERMIKVRQSHQDISRKLKKKDQEIESINLQVGKLRDSIRQRQDAILARLRVQYMEGRFGYWKTLLASDSYGDFQRRLQYLSAVSERDYDLMEGFRSDVRNMEQAERQREVARVGMLAYKRGTEKQLEEIKTVKKEKRTYLTKITHEKESSDRALQELEKSASRVDGLLRELENRRRAAMAKPPSGASIPKGVKGGLPWPADGTVISYFGRQKHPTFNTYVQRKGIEIKAAEGSAIKAVMSGTVVYADWLKGYGLVIIVDHANGFFSLYAHASKILASVGARVDATQPIGETGDTGMTGENTLYFELRQGAEPVDPLQWLARR
ncbi:putative Murein hydrolase EnvC [Nitrospira sp. KM1]|uniref:murein hydrolase activator EnvC family protein n=1 Tax=Nitrospira sp. KM1 TaxID=1936990 RepID=UPI0013A78540|nr:peptidoglycan DD-metalloendopeptidase family protein [Nitrospira sp. KM1]BCA54284.1 putative Murein hydrolase EnvC [Nitrospira sp. KM1]